MRRECISLVGILLCASSALAQTPAENLYTDAARTQDAYIQDLVMRSAEKATDDVYGFKPTPEVRSFAGVLGHIADANMLLCRIAAGQTDVDAVMKDLAALQVHEKKTTKPDLVAALKESRAFCEGELAKLTDAQRAANGQMVRKPADAEAVDVRDGHQPRLGALRQSRHVHASEGDRAAVERAAASAVGPVMPCPCLRRMVHFEVAVHDAGGNNSVVECDLAKVEVAGSNPVSRSSLRSLIAHRWCAAEMERRTGGNPSRSSPVTPIGAVAKW